MHLLEDLVDVRGVRLLGLLLALLASGLLGRLVGVAFLISNLVPFFGTITGFASAISGTIICWTLPYIFALKVGDLTSFEAASTPTNKHASLARSCEGMVVSTRPSSKPFG